MKRQDTTASVSFLQTRQSSIYPVSPDAASPAAPPLGQMATAGSMAAGGSRFFGASARGGKLTRPLSTTADLGVVFTVRGCLLLGGFASIGGIGSWDRSKEDGMMIEAINLPEHQDGNGSIHPPYPTGH